MSDVILHVDANCFYASVEMNENPELRGKKIAVCGSTENRHGIVLTASYPAKRCGVKTGMANWPAKQACPDLIMVPPHYDLYLKYSKYLRNIYLQYSDDVEPFGMHKSFPQRLETCVSRHRMETTMRLTWEQMARLLQHARPYPQARSMQGRRTAGA